MKDLVKSQEYMSLTKEFNAKNTRESQFASYCDKLELMLQMKLYEEQGYSNMYSEENAPLLQAGWIQKLMAGGSNSVSDLFVDYHKPSFNGDVVFDSFADYIRDNDITESALTKKHTIK